MNLGAYTTDARNIILMAVAHRHKLPKPSLGLCGLTYAAFNDILNYSEHIKAYLKRSGYNAEDVLFSHLENDDKLSIIFLRARLAMDIYQLPVTPKAQAQWLKTNLGGEAEQYLSDWELWRNE